MTNSMTWPSFKTHGFRRIRFECLKVFLWQFQNGCQIENIQIWNVAKSEEFDGAMMLWKCLFFWKLIQQVQHHIAVKTKMILVFKTQYKWTLGSHTAKLWIIVKKWHIKQVHLCLYNNHLNNSTCIVQKIWHRFI